ncbi:hypothetical protein JTB14_011355 [Gonioctena quinquepunctata]|nr:hypothetical protein JTB14_011355 [Gonioctena quinquepunctata]
MARHYTAFQFEAPYKARALKNWEVPKIFCERAHQRFGRTRIIANSRGHLLPDVLRSQGNPWEEFIGTWHLPKHIDRRMADSLNGTLAGKEIKKCIKAQKKSGVETTLEQKPEAKTVESEEVPPIEAPAEKVVSSAEVPAEAEQEKKISCPIHDLYKSK